MIANPETCPSVEDLAAFAEGRLQGAERERVVAHLAGCDECREVVAGVMAGLEEVGETRPRRHWLAPTLALAAGLALATVAVVYRVAAVPSPPDRGDWLASIGDPAPLLGDLWGGVVLRGGDEIGTLNRQSAELGALLVDLEVAAAAGDDPRADDVLRRMASIAEGAGLLDDETARLRQWAGEDGERQREQVATGLPALEARLRERFSPFYLDLGAFAEQVRLAGLVGRHELTPGDSGERYLEWVLTQDQTTLSPAVREQVLTLQRAGSRTTERASAASGLLQMLTR